MIGQVREEMEEEGKHRGRKGEETCVLVHIIHRREDGKGMKMKEEGWK